MACAKAMVVYLTVSNFEANGGYQMSRMIVSWHRHLFTCTTNKPQA
jgi:hypothetical protein